MMVPKKSLILAGAALALLGASSSAQSQSGKVFARYNKPLRSVSLDLETGTLTRAPAVQDKKLATCANFSNVDLGGFIGVDTGNKFCEWFDAGQGNGCGTDMMRSILFAYCSATQAVGSGGVGGSVRLGFYEGYAVGGGAPTTAVAVFTLTGLPANTADSSFFGGFRCYFIRVTFNPLINFVKGPLAYSWHFMDVGQDGTLAATFPFLSCVQSCSGQGPDGSGMIDFIDEYCPSGVFPPRATFTFGTTPFGGYFTSISMQIEKVVANPCLVNQNPGDNGCMVCNWQNVIELLPTTINNCAVDIGFPPDAACLGQLWAPRVQLNAKGPHPPPAPNGGIHGLTGVAAYKIFVPATPSNGPCPANPFSPYNARVELGLKAGALQVLTIAGSIVGGKTQIPPQLVAKDIAFLCEKWACFADIVSGGVRCRSKTLYGTVGAF